MLKDWSRPTDYDVEVLVHTLEEMAGRHEDDEHEDIVHKRVFRGTFSAEYLENVLVTTTFAQEKVIPIAPFIRAFIRYRTKANTLLTPWYETGLRMVNCLNSRQCNDKLQTVSRASLAYLAEDT